MGNQSAQLPDGYRYWAFISYSHSDNRDPEARWADWLHEALETYRLPPTVLGQIGSSGFVIPERLFPVFQDEKELPTQAALGVALEAALRQSVFLVVLCSPRSARSHWVGEEVLFFKRLGREDRILTVILDGEPNASEPGKEWAGVERECFHEALRYELGSDGAINRLKRTEPIAADVRYDDGRVASVTDPSHAQTLERERLRIVAGIAGIGFDELVQRDRQREVQRLLQEKADRQREAKDLFADAETALVLLKSEGPRHGPEFIFKQLGHAEELLLRAGQKDPELGEVPQRLREVRTLLVETGIESGDLNMATVFLARLKQEDAGTSESAAVGLRDRLQAEWSRTDPRMNRKLRWAADIAFLAPLVGWACCVVAMFVFAGDVSPDSPLSRSWIWMFPVIIPTVPAMICQRLIANARAGDEVSHRRAVYQSYFTAVLGALTFNLPVFIGFALVIHILTSVTALRLYWRSPTKN